uniref:Uncharacterized protein n=1 Tax=Anopheles maculatus TaxID=74869 RepID=A0A182SFM9_9DIPT
MGSKSSPIKDSPTDTLSSREIPANKSSSLESFSSTIECTPEPHATQPQTALQCLDHAIGIIWHCFDAFRQQCFTISPEKIEWAVDFLEASTNSSTDELHFVLAYLRCVQALVQLVFRKSRAVMEPPSVDATVRHSVTEATQDDSSTPQEGEDEEIVPQNIIEELLRLYALLARYKEEIKQHHQNTIELNQLQEIEQLLQEFNDSFDKSNGDEDLQIG